MPATPPRLFTGADAFDDGLMRLWRTETLDSEECSRLIADGRMDDPAAYKADPGLVDAMNVALLLGRPLLLTGRPGTGKSQFADRVAWEFDLAPVLRFEAQSISEARDLFYTFDTIGRMAVARPGVDVALSNAAHFATLAALGKAVLYSKPRAGAGSDDLRLSPPHPDPLRGRASVVLIDEIDKASRDFPNDLLNAIDRLGFEMPELDGRRFEASRDAAVRPIVIITSNSERELPEPFLRRCVYYNIPDPSSQTLAHIVAARIAEARDVGADAAHAAASGTELAGHAPLHPLYRDLVDCFIAYGAKEGRNIVFSPGTSELIDLARVVAADPEVHGDEGLAHDANRASVRRAAAAVAKGKGDADRFGTHVDGWARK